MPTKPVVRRPAKATTRSTKPRIAIVKPTNPKPTAQKNTKAMVQVFTQTITLFAFTAYMERLRSPTPPPRPSFETYCECPTKEIRTSAFGSYGNHVCVPDSDDSEGPDVDSEASVELVLEDSFTHCDQCCDCLWNPNPEFKLVKDQMERKEYFLSKMLAISRFAERALGRDSDDSLAEYEDDDMAEIDLSSYWDCYGVSLDSDGLPQDWENCDVDPISFWVDKVQVTATILVMNGKEKLVSFEDAEGKDMSKLKIEDWNGDLKALGYGEKPAPQTKGTSTKLKTQCTPKSREKPQNGPSSKGGSEDWKRWSFAVIV